MFSTLIETAIEALFPQQCRLCRLPSENPLPICDYCRASLCKNISACRGCAIPLNTSALAPSYCPDCLNKPPPWSSIIAPFLYEPNLACLIQQWKYQGESRLAALFATLWLDTVETPLKVDLLVTVPLHWARLVHRGFNQTELLLRELQKVAPALEDVDADPKRVRKHRHTPHQVGQGASERRRNLQGAFTVNQPCDNLRVAVIEDVVTTGATASAISTALLNAGAIEVHIWCLARAPLPEQ